MKQALFASSMVQGGEKRRTGHLSILQFVDQSCHFGQKSKAPVAVPGGEPKAPPGDQARGILGRAVRAIDTAFYFALHAIPISSSRFLRSAFILLLLVR
jgi:hypothetical protein